MIRSAVRTAVLAVAALAMTSSLALAQTRVSKPFSGAKVNGAP
jgi:hypothetical protein